MKWKIPLYKIYRDEDDTKAVNAVIERGTHWTNGPENIELEKNLASYVGSKYALGFNNGTSALHAMLLAYGIGAGTEVIVPSFTFISTANSVLFTGAKPVFADIENESYALDPEDVRKKINEKTKAIMPIHYGGSPAIKIKELRELADEKGVLLLEDAAESLGAKINDEKVGSFGDSAILSFCANKVITSGEGGAVTTNSEEIYEKLKLIRSHGRAENENYFESNKYMDYIDLGFNFRMSSITAALANSQLEKIDRIIDMRRSVAKKYDEAFFALDMRLPANSEDVFNVYQMYTIRMKDRNEREGLRKHLENEGIMSKVYFNPVHNTHFYKNILGYNISLPTTDKISGEVLSIPIFAGMNNNDIDYICNSIKTFVK